MSEPQPHEHQWNWIDAEPMPWCLKCGLTAEAHIAALETENAALRLRCEIAEDSIVAGQDHLNIAGKEIAALTAENAQLRARLAHFAAIVNGKLKGGLASLRERAIFADSQWYPSMTTADILYIADGDDPPTQKETPAP